MSSSTTTLLIDTDILLYKAASAAETEIDWSDDVWTLFTDLDDAKRVFQLQLDRITDKLGVSKFLCCLSDHGNNFRKTLVDPTYKSQRKGTRKPVGYVALCSWVEDTFPSMRKPTLEADDVMGIIATKPDMKGSTIIVSDDKDMRTISGKLYRPMSEEQLDISDADADRFFLTQVLTGDPIDGYAGIKGVGPKTAERILGSRPSWGAVEQAYIQAGMTRDDAIRQARLARILRWSEWNEQEGRVKLWQP